MSAPCWRRRAGTLPSGYGHVELTYDFEAGHEADGWMHALFRYRDRASGHAAESSFGSHMFNSVLVYKNEPQSYSGRAPGLTTRLFLRIGPKALRYAVPPDLSGFDALACEIGHGADPDLEPGRGNRAGACRYPL